MGDQKLYTEIESFKSLWKGGFRTGYYPKRNQKGLEDYLRFNMSGNCCLEIGCGGGQWSKYIYNLNIFDKIYCIDILSAEHNNFWEYVGNEKKDKITYIQVKDFSLKEIPEKNLDYVFSYDVFCHISYSGQNAYLKNLLTKCNPNCKLLIMYADPRKYFLSEPEHIYIQENEMRTKGISFNNKQELIDALISDCDSKPFPNGRWYWVGMIKFAEMCISNNYKVINLDLDIDKTNPITLFTPRHDD